MSNFRFPGGPVWTFHTKNFLVMLVVKRDRDYQYDGDDENNETQDKLDSGEFVAFNAFVTVEWNGEEIGYDSLHGSVYDADRVAEFWEAHRGSDPMDRNCSIMRAERGDNACIGHYFPDMVQAAIQLARAHIRSLPSVPYIRESAA